MLATRRCGASGEAVRQKFVTIAVMVLALPMWAVPTHAKNRRAEAAKYSASPITPGFWAWARKRPASAAEITELCRAGLAIQLSNGRYLTLRLSPSPPTVIDQGRCTFNRQTQIERCELTVTEKPGETKKGFME